MDDVPLHKKSRLEDNTAKDTCTNSKLGSDVKEAVIPSKVFGFRKASELKPLKQLKDNLDRRTSVKLKAVKPLANYAHKDGQSLVKCSQLTLNTQTASKDIHDRRKPCERSSLGDHDTASPGDPVGVKDVANVVVKYLSPYLKQGSIVSKVTGTYACTCGLKSGFVYRARIRLRLEELKLVPVISRTRFSLLRCCIKQRNELFGADMDKFLKHSA